MMGGRTLQKRWDRPVRLTALYHEHLALGAVMKERFGWLLPVSYGDPAAEIAAIREGAGLSDIGDIGKLDIQGSDLDLVLGDVFGEVADRADEGGHAGSWPLRPGNASQLSRGAPGVGRVADVGTSVTALHLTEDHVLLLTPPEGREDVLDRVLAAAGGRDCAHAVDLTGAFCGLRLSGPMAPAVMERLCPLDLSPAYFTDGSVAEGAVARIHTIIARRDATRHSYDLFVDRDLGAYLWDAMLETGVPLGLRPVGRAMEDT